MAKKREALSLDEMEKLLGYKVANLDNKKHRWFYSDLTPVPESVYERTRKELDDYQKRSEMLDHEGLSTSKAFTPYFTKTIEYGHDVIHIERICMTGLYSFTAYIRYSFSFKLALVLTENEVLKVLATAMRFQNATTSSEKSLAPTLPQELRDMIYDFAIRDDKWQKHDANNEFDTSIFFRGLGDPSGFYFPLGRRLAVLTLNKQIRHEALPLAYRNTSFYFDDIDDFIKFGISVGSIGRRNIMSLEFAWESRADLLIQAPPTLEEDVPGPLPSIHVSRCVTLLRQFTKLKRLRLWFDGDILSRMPLEDFKSDPGISGLCSLQGLEKVDILGFDVDHSACPISLWLKGILERSWGF